MQITEDAAPGSPWPREYEEFVRLFNEREFFEAHEVLEDLWVLEVPPLKDFYKGLIQSAVALCHWERGNTSGARKLYLSAMNYLSPYPAHFEGLAIGDLREQFHALFAPMMNTAPGAPLPAPEPSRLPFLRLRSTP